MEETLQHQATTQCLGLLPASPGNHRPDGTQAKNALTFKLDHSGRADQRQVVDDALQPPLVLGRAGVHLLERRLETGGFPDRRP